MNDTGVRAKPSSLDAVIAIVYGHAIFQIAATVVRLGILDLLEDGARSADELAADTAADPAALYRLLRAAAAIGLVTISPERKFELAELGGVFHAESSTGAKTAVTMSSLEPCWRAWGGLADAVRTGRSAFEGVHGTGIFEYLEHDRELAEVFHSSMAAGTAGLLPQLVRHYDFRDAKHIVDIGGGNGTHLAAILARDEWLRGTVFDTPEGLHDTRRVLQATGVADRCETVVGDFFVAIPPGADVYLLKNVLTDWDDESCAAILRTCRAAMPADGKLLIVGTLMPEGAGEESAADELAASIFDMSLMVMTSGRERTLADYAELLTGAGFTIHAVTPITTGAVDYTILYRIIEARPEPARQD
jgi:orsellinic acid C2-O-methyltransferase